MTSLRDTIKWVDAYEANHKNAFIAADTAAHTIRSLHALAGLMREALDNTSNAYCGVGDFEGTGENMTSVIMQVRKALAAYDEAMGNGHDTSKQ